MVCKYLQCQTHDFSFRVPMDPSLVLCRSGGSTSANAWNICMRHPPLQQVSFLGRIGCVIKIHANSSKGVIVNLKRLLQLIVQSLLYPICFSLISFLSWEEAFCRKNFIVKSVIQEWQMVVVVCQSSTLIQFCNFCRGSGLEECKC